MNTQFDFWFKTITPAEINAGIAERIRTIRRRRKISQEKLSEQSGVSLGSVKRFERSGEISLLSLTKIAIALGLQTDMQNLFKDIPFQSIEEIKNAENNRT
ncbi:MAG: transcriptional regulator [Phascolarctobacterium sp.]|nr:MAG: transcriptional regulator [Phascolarctobacterium sp.]